MGMDRKVTLPPNTVPAWDRLAAYFAARQFAVRMTMIDGELSFPDETPPETWRELRLGTPNGMVTLRREDDGVRVVIWGNATGPMLEDWNAVTMAVAEAFGGLIQEA